MQRIRLAVPALVAACALVVAGAATAAAGPVWVVVPDAPSASPAAPSSSAAPDAATSEPSLDQTGAAAQLQDTGLAAKLDDFLSTQGSPMAGAGASFVSAGRQTGIDPRYLVALSGAESSFGKYLFRPFNPFG